MAAPVYTLKLCDRQNTVISDVTAVAPEKKGSYRHNRPAIWTFRVPLDQTEVIGNHSDGFPKLSALDRQLKVYRTPSTGGSPLLIFNGLVWNVNRSAGEDGTGSALVTAIDPMIWWNFRAVRDLTGALIDPTYKSPMSGAAIIKEALQASLDFHTASLAVNITDGDWDTTIPPAYDLSGVFSDWPVQIGDVVRRITDTGACDVWVEPVDNTFGSSGAMGAGYGLEDTGFSGSGQIAVMGRVHAVNMRGTDKTASVHFDFATGDYSIREISHTQDAETIANYLHFYFGPRLNRRHWRGHLTGGADLDDPHAMPDPPQAALNTMRDASRNRYGVFEDIQVYDDETFDNDPRQMFWRLWQLQFRLRVYPKELINFTPIADAAFLPFEDYDIGDIIAVNAGGNVLGFNFTDAAQRVYGFDVDVDENGVERVGQIVAAAGEVGS